jgi:UDP-GlcNAc:undecaprenyl-phosphate/decaprenyl-phosphate GlcNAc-1-phosphate transferase
VSRARRVLTFAVAAAAARAAWQLLRTAPPGGAERWQRTNHRGEVVTLLEGPALAAAAALGAAGGGGGGRLRAAGTIAAVGAGAFGAIDDLVESPAGAAKGLRGHLGSLASGQVTTGALKVLGIGATGLASALLAVPARPGGRLAGRAVDVVTGAALIAGFANLVNLLDLRPGRALKATLLCAALGPPGVAAAAGGLVASVAGPAAALLPEDLGERGMLGDTGANASGAVLGTALAAGLSRGGRIAALAGVVALTLASERVSFTAVIESTPGLRELDALGRRPALRP